MPAHRPVVLPLLLALQALVATPAWSAANTPDAAVAAFYAWTLGHPSAALPPRRDDARLAGLLTPDLLDLLRRARATEERCARTAAKGDKPLLLEGDLFAGNHEGASEVAYGALQQEGGHASGEVTLIYIDRHFRRAHPLRTVVWRDRVELQRIGSDWRVSDIGYGGGGSLLAVLNRHIADGIRECGGKQGLPTKRGAGRPKHEVGQPRNSGSGEQHQQMLAARPVRADRQLARME